MPAAAQRFHRILNVTGQSCVVLGDMSLRMDLITRKNGIRGAVPGSETAHKYSDTY